jgi:hypothetical protein
MDPTCYERVFVNDRIIVWVAVEGATWSELESGAPDLARAGAERLSSTRLLLLGTVRRDGSPRISPIEPFFTEADLVIGAMAWSLKARDLARDPRYAAHSTVSGPQSGEGELKLYGRALAASDKTREAATGGWWLEARDAAASVFVLRIFSAVYVEWDYEQGQMTLLRWSPGDGFSRRTRSYP